MLLTKLRCWEKEEKTKTVVSLQKQILKMGDEQNWDFIDLENESISIFNFGEAKANEEESIQPSEEGHIADQNQKKKKKRIRIRQKHSNLGCLQADDDELCDWRGCTSEQIDIMEKEEIEYRKHAAQRAIKKKQQKVDTLQNQFAKMNRMKEVASTQSIIRRINHQQRSISAQIDQTIASTKQIDANQTTKR